MTVRLVDEAGESPKTSRGYQPRDAPDMTPEAGVRGMYGIGLAMPDARALLHPAGTDWPALEVEQRLGPADRIQPHWDEEGALLNVQGGGFVVVRRDPLTAIFSLPTLRPDVEMVHPFLAGTSAVVNWWQGREAFHAGAFVYAERAWIVVGSKGNGKSSLLGHLAARGVPVLADDVVVLDGQTVLAGPACIDLRADAALHLGVGRNLGVVGARERWRVNVPTAPSRVPLGGWIVQEWSEVAYVERVPSLARLMVFMPHLSLRRPRKPAAMLPLSQAPCLLFVRPQRWDRLHSAVELLLDELTQLPT